MANAYFNQGNDQKALEAIEKCLNIDPESVNAFNLQGLCYLRRQDVSNGELAFQKSIELNPRNSVGYYYLGLIESQRNNLQAALEMAKKAIEKNPQFKEAYILAADIFDKMGNPDQADRFRNAVKQLN